MQCLIVKLLKVLKEHIMKVFKTSHLLRPHPYSAVMKGVNYQVNKQQLLRYLVRHTLSVFLFVISNIRHMDLQNMTVVSFLSYTPYREV